MALTKLEKDMNIVQALDDEPNDVGGLTAAALKAKFDEGGAAVKEYLNDTLTPELDTALDGKAPTTRTVNGHPLSTDVTVTKADVGLKNADNTSDADKPVSTAQQAALDLKANKTDVLEKSNTASFTPSADYHPATKKYVDDTTAAVVMGILPDKSVTSDKLADSAVTTGKMADSAVTTGKMADSAVTPEKLSEPYAPLVHAARHAPGGADPITPEAIGAAPASDLAAYDKTVKATYPAAAGQSITAGDVVDVVGGEVTTRKAQVGGLAIGTIIKLNENGSPVDYIVVHQGLPSSMYDASCDGTWILRKDIFENRQWNSSDVNDWANSTLKTYLDGTFLARYDANIQAAIKQVKIPYRPGSGTSTTVNSGANGLSCKVFALSGYEMGWTNSDNQYFPADGAKLSYFDAGTGTAANNKRIGYLSGSAANWWLRSPHTSSSTYAWFVNTGGNYNNSDCSYSYGVRPAFILPSNFAVKVKDAPQTSQAIALTTATAGQNCEVIYSGVAALSGITVGQKITSDGVYGVGVLAGVLQVWSKDRPGQVVTGSYVGTGTYGVSDPNRITFSFPPKVVWVFASKASNSKNVASLHGSYNHPIIPMEVLTEEFVGGVGLGSSDSPGGLFGRKINDGKTIEWYESHAAGNQYNATGATYWYMGIG